MHTRQHASPILTVDQALRKEANNWALLRSQQLNHAHQVDTSTNTRTDTDTESQTLKDPETDDSRFIT